MTGIECLFCVGAKYKSPEKFPKKSILIIQQNQFASHYRLDSIERIIIKMPETHKAIVLANYNNIQMWQISDYDPIHWEIDFSDTFWSYPLHWNANYFWI